MTLACFGYVLGVLLLGSCSQPFAATDDHPLAPDEKHVNFVLNGQEQQRAEQAFAQFAAGHKPVNPPRAAPNPPGMRWSDVEIAVSYACDDAEVAIISTTIDQSKTRFHFQLKTIEDWPGNLVVERTNDDRVYIATATIGLFDDHPDRVALLLSSLQKQMKAFGKKRKIEAGR